MEKEIVEKVLGFGLKLLEAYSKKVQLERRKRIAEEIFTEEFGIKPNDATSGNVVRMSQFITYYDFPPQSTSNITKSFCELFEQLIGRPIDDLNHVEIAVVEGQVREEGTVLDMRRGLMRYRKNVEREGYNFVVLVEINWIGEEEDDC